VVNNQSLKIYIFYCSSDFNIAEQVWSYSEYQNALKAIPLPCSGKIDIPYLTKAFEAGADGVAVIMCKQGECRFLEGDLRARKRAEVVDTLLEEIGLGKGRVAVIQMKDGGVEQVMREIEEFRARIEAWPNSVLDTGIQYRSDL
jgi:coenzyme F420-reducing hydrogenase delta subunit